VADQHQGRARLALRLAEQVEHLSLDRDVQRGRGLVGEDHVRVVGDGHGDHGALAHAAGELVRVGLGPPFWLGDADRPEQLDGLGMGLLPAQVRVGAYRLGDLDADAVDGGEGRQRILEDHGDLGTADPHEGAYVGADQFGVAEPYRTLDRGRGGQQAHRGQGRHGLARARLTHDAQYLAAAKVPAHRIDGDGIAEADRQIADAEDHVVGRRF
jgi:hypothetical protein